MWARAGGGHWGVGDEPTLVSFLIVFLLYATYQPMRFSIEDREKQARYASVFAVTAGGVVPPNSPPPRPPPAHTPPPRFAAPPGGPPAEKAPPVYPPPPGLGP